MILSQNSQFLPFLLLSDPQHGLDRCWASVVLEDLQRELGGAAPPTVFHYGGKCSGLTLHSTTGPQRGEKLMGTKGLNTELWAKHKNSVVSK